MILELVIVSMVPIILWLTGMIFYKWPVKNTNYIIGYRTQRSMKSKEAWDFSQKEFAKAWIKLGGYMLVISVSIYYLAVIIAYPLKLFVLSFGVYVQLGVMLASIFLVEKKLKERFK